MPFVALWYCIFFFLSFNLTLISIILPTWHKNWWAHFWKRGLVFAIMLPCRSSWIVELVLSSIYSSLWDDSADSFHYFLNFIPVPPVVVRNDEWTWEEAYYYLYEERAFDNIVISPGPGSPICAAVCWYRWGYSGLHWFFSYYLNHVYTRLFRLLNFKILWSMSVQYWLMLQS